MRGIERGHHDAAELAVAVEEAPRELHRPLPAGAADDRLADEEPVFRAVDMDAVVLAVAQIDRRRGLRAGIGRPHDALGVDDGDLDDDLAQQVGGVDDGVVVGRCPGAFRWCGAGRAATCRSRRSSAARSPRTPSRSCGWCARLRADRRARPGVFQADAAPQHGDDHHAEQRRSSPLGDQLRQLCQMQFHRNAGRPIIPFCGILTAW